MAKESELSIREKNNASIHYYLPWRKTKLSTGITDPPESSSQLFMGLEEISKESPFFKSYKRGKLCISGCKIHLHFTTSILKNAMEWCRKDQHVPCGGRVNAIV